MDEKRRKEITEIVNQLTEDELALAAEFIKMLTANPGSSSRADTGRTLPVAHNHSRLAS